MTDARTFAETSSSAIVLRLDKPFSTNAMYRSFSRGKGGLTTIKSAAYRSWREHALGLLATQKWTPIDGAFGLQIKVPKGNRIDLDNCIKSASDLLRDVGVIKDDSPKYMRRVEVVIGLDNHTTLTIKPLETTDALD